MKIYFTYGMSEPLDVQKGAEILIGASVLATFISLSQIILFQHNLIQNFVTNQQGDEEIGAAVTCANVVVQMEKQICGTKVIDSCVVL
jgi:hypothetical protein